MRELNFFGADPYLWCRFETKLDASLLQRLRECSNGGFVLGNERFAQQIAVMVGRCTSKGSPGRLRKRYDDEGQGQLRVIGEEDSGENVVCPRLSKSPPYDSRYFPG